MSEGKIPTKYVAYKADGKVYDGTAEMAEQPTYNEINALVRPLISTMLTTHDYIEHVTVLHEGERRDMFVDEQGEAKNLPRNEAATTVYRNNWLTAHPKADPESIPYVYGDAVLFTSRQIWF
jgi:hypothetical protein